MSASAGKPTSPTFSVVIPTYNRPRMLIRAVSSVLAQTMEAFEIIIVDDCSTSSYREVVGAFRDPRVRTLRLPQHSGAAAARNAAVQNARGRYVAFLDDDDEFMPTFLAETHRLYLDQPMLAFSWAGVRIVEYSAATNEPVSSSVRLFAAHYPDREQMLRELMSIGTGFGFSIARQCLLDLGLFDPGLRCTEDTELFIRLIAAGHAAGVVSSVQAILHNHFGQRATGTAMNARRVNEIEQLLRRYESFFTQHPSLRAQLVGHMHYLLGTPEVRPIHAGSKPRAAEARIIGG